MSEQTFRDVQAEACAETEAWKSKRCKCHEEVMANHKGEDDIDGRRVAAMAVRANEHLSRQVESLEGQLNERGEQVDFNADLVDKANAEVKRLHGEADYKGMFDGMLVVEANLREKIEELESKIKLLDPIKQKVFFDSIIAGLETRLATQAQSIEQLQTDNKNSHNLVYIRDKTIEVLESELRESCPEVREMREKWEKAKAEIERLRTVSNFQTAQADVLKAKVKDVTMQRDGARKTAEEMRDLYRKSCDDFHEMREKLRDATESAIQWQADWNTSRKHASELHEEVLQLRTDVSELKTVLGFRKHQVGKRDAEIAKLKAQVADAKQPIFGGAMIKYLAKEVKDYKRRLADWAVEYQKMCNKYCAQLAESCKLDKTIASQKDHIRRLESYKVVHDNSKWHYQVFNGANRAGKTSRMLGKFLCNTDCKNYEEKEMKHRRVEPEKHLVKGKLCEYSTICKLSDCPHIGPHEDDICLHALRSMACPTGAKCNKYHFFS